ncbi:hypothetical protein MXD59_02375 [Frankia sp. Ag45/Mut15]|uniref:Class I SAM-dependent methyltransferase n=1 Tax=Frankia umida TaxID=573489 RepID=A0ABT0JSZ1_9ACTN|nr:hypothetical protein [Frankia umida]MCK9874639.1 hypothetical protein [Frankia umida]
MRRRHLFEFEDLGWFPGFLRDAVTDWLRDTLVVGRKVYAPVVPMLIELLDSQGTNQIVDLCSGGSGPWAHLKPDIDQARAAVGDLPVTVTLTDLYPNVAAFEAAAKKIGDGLQYRTESIDARSVPTDLTGIRTMFTSFHHLRPDAARVVLADAFSARRAVGVFEFTERRWAPIAQTVVLAPVLVLANAARHRPAQWRRLLLTYVLPVVPVAVTWDGIVSNLRTRTAVEMLALTADLAADDYVWRTGQTAGSRSGPPVTYLLGTPMVRPSHQAGPENPTRAADDRAAPQAERRPGTIQPESGA